MQFRFSNAVGTAGLFLALALPAAAAHHEASAHGKAKGKLHEKATQVSDEVGEVEGAVAEEAAEAKNKAKKLKSKAGKKAEAAKQKVRDVKGEAHEAHEAHGEAMRERRDQRKAIMEEAKQAHEPGTPQAGKKPWWKFWGSDAAQ